VRTTTTADITVPEFDLAGVQARPDLQTDRPQFIPQGRRAANPSPGAIEGSQYAVTGRLDELALEFLDYSPGQLVVHLQQLTPAPIAQPAGLFGGPDNVSKQHGRQHPGGRRRPP
jgi:hypothetical protein